MKIKLQEFIISLQNNIYLDIYTNKLFFKDKKENYLINPMRFFSIRKKAPTIFGIIYPIFLFFSPLLVTLKITLDFFKIFIKKYRINKKCINQIKKAIILTDINALRILEKEGYNEAIIITQPLNNFLIKNEYQNKLISTLSIISIKEILLDYLLSLYSIFSIIKSFGYKNAMYAANSLEWFMIYDLLKSNELKSCNEIIFSNQKDRWAILYDRVFEGKKTLIQHGTNMIQVLPNDEVKPFTKFIDEHNAWSLVMPVKYSNINKLYAFSHKESDFLLEGEFEKAPEEIQIIGYNFIIHKYKRNEDRIFVLLIGNINVFKPEEEYVINNLSKLKYKLLVKPHPLNDKTKYYQIDKEVELVDTNPDVDIVISYNSTLAYEYESLCYEVIIYKDLEDLEKIILKLNEK